MGSLALSSPGFRIRSKSLSHLASFQIDERLGPRKVSCNGGRRPSFTIRAVAHLEPKCADHPVGDGVPVDQAVVLGDKESSRRSRISRANRGIVPWNKGKKHSPETIRKIRERTRIAMRSPKVRMKLVNFGHSQSKETKQKIAAGVRMGWMRRQKRMKVQQTCSYEWENLIAEASRKGLFGLEEMEWNSYNILDKQLEKEWLGPRKVSCNGGRRPSFTIRALAHLEPKCADHPVGDGVPVDQAVVLGDKESSRRSRISRANRGIVPWNKGKKHSPETIRKIRERTRIAMRSPKVRMKLVNFGHSQSKETKQKIAAGVRMGWMRRRKRMKVQQTCSYEWENLIAEASRKGLFGLEEMEWNSYNILDKQLEKEWLDSVEQRKSMPRPEGGKRAPKPPEQRRKIADAVAAKWADPDYRERVCSGMAKHYGTDARSESKPRRSPGSKTKSTGHNSLKKKTTSTQNASTKGSIERSAVWISNMPLYKDPLTSSKLEMIKNIRSQRKAAESEIVDIVERARLLIAQAEEAAEALEFAATRSVIAQASVLEARKLIAEAVELIESVEAREVSSDENPRTGSSGGRTRFSGQDGYQKINGSSKEPSQRSTVNRRQSTDSSNCVDFDFSEFIKQNVLNLESRFTVSRSGEMSMLSDGTRGSVHSDQGEASPRPSRLTKKWVRGRLVEVIDEV